MYKGKVYYIRTENKAFYSLKSEDLVDYTYWTIDPEYIFPYIIEWPYLLTPQYIN